MPRYEVDISHLVSLDQAKGMIEAAQRPRDRFIVAFLFLTGARPGEMLLMKKEWIVESEDKISMTVPTLKLGETEEFRISNRTLEFSKTDPFIQEILSYVASMPAGLLFNITRRRVEQIIEKLSDGTLCPYNFRHTRMTKLSRQGAGIDELMNWKGSLTISSVAPYLRGKPQGRKYKMD